jgi:hypothetical protein
MREGAGSLDYCRNMAITLLSEFGFLCFSMELTLPHNLGESLARETIVTLIICTKCYRTVP